jgi:hypothetical protein
MILDLFANRVFVGASVHNAQIQSDEENSLRILQMLYVSKLKKLIVKLFSQPLNCNFLIEFLCIER